MGSVVQAIVPPVVITATLLAAEDGDSAEVCSDMDHSVSRAPGVAVRSTGGWIHSVLSCFGLVVVEPGRVAFYGNVAAADCARIGHPEVGDTACRGRGRSCSSGRESAVVTLTR